MDAGSPLYLRPHRIRRVSRSPVGNVIVCARAPGFAKRLTLKIPGILRAVCTAAASASVSPIDAVWLAQDPKPAAEIVFRNLSTVGIGFHVVGTEKMNSMFASSQRLASSPRSRASIVR